MSTASLRTLDSHVLCGLAGAFQDALYRYEQALTHPGGSLDATQTRIELYAAMNAFYRVAKDLAGPARLPASTTLSRARAPVGARR